MDNWDEKLAALRIGYNASKHANTGMSPAQVLFARDPIIPPAIIERFATPLRFDGTKDGLKADTSSILDRALAEANHTIFVDNHLRIQAHQDTLRYAHTRSGGYAPRVRQFQVGDYVYVRYSAAQLTTLDTAARPDPVRVIHIGSTGSLTVLDHAGSTRRVNPTNCAPCHAASQCIPVDHRRSGYRAGTPCAHCNFADEDLPMLMCDTCNQPWHLGCITPPPTADTLAAPTWQCVTCIAQQQQLPASLAPLLPPPPRTHAPADSRQRHRTPPQRPVRVQNLQSPQR